MSALCSTDGCGATLGRDNRSGFCAKCSREKMSRERSAPPRYCAHGCGTALHRQTKGDVCGACRRKALSHQRDVEAAKTAKRIASGQETTEDYLRRETVTLRQANATLRNSLEQIQRNRSFEDRLLEDIREFILRTPYQPQIKPAPKVAASSHDHEMLALVSDAHVPEVVDPESSFGLAYNQDIATRRIEYLRDKIIRYRDLRATSYPTRKLTIGMIGDMLSGDIHEELEVTNQTPMSDALVMMAYLMHDFALSLTEAFPEVELIVIPGNHSRVTKKPRYKQKWNNWEYLLGKFIQAMAGDRFTVTTPKSLVWRTKIFDWNIGLAHGDGVKAQSFAGIPWYSMKQRKDALQALLRTLGMDQVDLLCYGHFHQLIYDDNLGLIINGTIKGGDEFSLGTRYSAPNAVQGLLTFHPKHGVTDLSRINLGHIQ